MLLVIQTYTWIFIILATFIPFALYHAKEMTKKIWDARIDEFALELQDGKKMLLFTERMKNEPFKLLGEYKGALVFLVFLSVIDILFWGITIFVLLISAINIWFVQSYNGALLLDFSLTMKLIGGVFQMVAWAFCNAGVWFASFFWHVEQVPSSEDLKPLYTAFFALTIIPTIFALIPWDDKIAPYSEQLKDPEAITIAKSKNRRVRNIFRVSVLVIVYLILQIGNYFSTTHVKMWENEGISRVGKAINHYGEQALAYEAPKMVADSTGVAPVTYSTPKGGTPSTTGVVSVGADGKPLLYEFVVEKWKYGTHVFVHLRDLHKRHGYSIPLLLAAMAGLLGKNIPEDFTRLSQSSINLETMTDKGQPAYQLNTEVAGYMADDVYYQYILDKNKKGESVSKWVALSGTKLAAAQNILGNSAYASTLIARDVVSEENGKTVYLYSLETPTGHTRRILSTKSYSNHDIHNLSAQDRTIYNVPESVYKLPNNQVPRGNELSHFIAIPNDEIALILQ